MKNSSKKVKKFLQNTIFFSILSGMIKVRVKGNGMHIKSIVLITACFAVVSFGQSSDSIPKTTVTQKATTISQPTNGLKKQAGIISVKPNKSTNWSRIKNLFL